MKLERAIEIIEQHNKWRRGEVVKIHYNVTSVGVAIDTIVKNYKDNEKELVEECNREGRNN